MNKSINSKAVLRELNCIEAETTIETKVKRDLTTIVTVGLFIAGFILISALCAFKVISIPEGF